MRVEILLWVHCVRLGEGGGLQEEDNPSGGGAGGRRNSHQPKTPTAQISKYRSPFTYTPLLLYLCTSIYMLCMEMDDGGCLGKAKPTRNLVLKVVGS